MLRLLGTLYLVGLTLYLLLRFIFGDDFWLLSLVNTFAPLVFLPLPFMLLHLWTRGQHWKRFLATGLGLYALLWFGPYFWPKGEAETLTSTFMVVSYNMHDIKRGLSNWLEELKPDIVLLQEVPQDFLDTLSPNLGEIYPHRLAQPQLYKGNAVLSRYPIVASEDLAGFGDYVPQRLVLNLDDRALAVYNVHLSWPIGNRRIPKVSGPLRLFSAYDDSRRNQDLALLIDLLEQESLPFIAGGDFNLSQHSGGYAQLAKRANDSFRLRGWGWGNTWLIDSSLPPILRIDYVWHSDELNTLEARSGPRRASDHLPVMASFAFQD